MSLNGLGLVHDKIVHLHVTVHVLPWPASRAELPERNLPVAPEAGHGRRMANGARPERRRKPDRRASVDRRELPPRPEGRRTGGGRRRGDPKEA
ncbi:MAG: hypothetical protein ABSE49_09915 [Polyangiaceae bacterium]